MSQDDFRTFQAPEKKRRYQDSTFRRIMRMVAEGWTKNAVGSRGSTSMTKDHVSDPEGWYRKFWNPSEGVGCGAGSRHSVKGVDWFSVWQRM